MNDRASILKASELQSDKREAKVAYCKYGAGLCQFRIELGNLKMCRRCLDSTLGTYDVSSSLRNAFGTRFTS